MGEQQFEVKEIAVSLPHIAEHVGHTAVEAPFFDGLNIKAFQQRLKGPVAGEPEPSNAPEWNRRIS